METYFCTSFFVTLFVESVDGFLHCFLIRVFDFWSLQEALETNVTLLGLLMCRVCISRCFPSPCEDSLSLPLCAGIARKFLGVGNWETEGKVAPAPLLSRFPFAPCGPDPVAAQALLALGSCGSGSGSTLSPLSRCMGCHRHPTSLLLVTFSGSC